MCIGIPVKLVEIGTCSGTGEIEGVQLRISLVLVPEAKVGDYILVHAGCGLQVIDKQAAAQTLDLLRQLQDETY